MVNIQYKKGVIELCILSALNKADMYGYELSTYISKEIDISDGTVYPILRKLKSDGFVTIFISEISGGPPRKYYSITEAGRNKYKTEAKEWLEFSETIRKMLGGEKHD
jgi:PadR family transcriptional regulator PadR